MARKQELPTSGGINHWVNALKYHSLDLASHLDTNRADGYIALEKMGLPTSKQMVFKPLASFFIQPEAHLETIGANQFFVNLSPMMPNLKKLRCLGLSNEEVVPYITSNIAETHYHDYNLVIGEYLKNLYGGTIIINSEGKLLLEMVEGLQHYLAEGQKSPKYTVTRNEFTGIFRYREHDKTDDESADSFDPVLRDAVWRTISCIPHIDHDSPRDRQYTKGYYEFILVKPDSSQYLEPRFIDYNDNPVYYSF